MADLNKRKFLGRALTGAATLGLTGCYDLSQKPWFVNILGSVEYLTKPAQHVFAGRNTLVPEFTPADISPIFKANGTLDPGTDDYNAHVANHFADWQIEIGGLVDRPTKISLAQLRAMPARSQITRHDCVEGWSCIGQWRGAPLRPILEAALPKPEARYVMFFCADPMTAEGDPSHLYYESLDMIEAMHPQTILAYEMNGAPLTVPHGAPVRLRAERQLGYKQPKYVQRIELVANFDRIEGGKGGYWEDQGYTWYGGI